MAGCDIRARKRKDMPTIAPAPNSAAREAMVHLTGFFMPFPSLVAFPEDAHLGRRVDGDSELVAHHPRHRDPWDVRDVTGPISSMVPSSVCTPVLPANGAGVQWAVPQFWAGSASFRR